MTDEMIATERIRQLLDDRGVGHIDYGGRGHDDETGRPATWWSSEQGECAAIQRDDDLLTVEAHLTPEQAVEATLGRETCHWEYPQGVNGWVGYIVCSACGHQFSGVDEREWTCCPCCRREIKEVDA